MFKKKPVKKARRILAEPPQQAPVQQKENKLAIAQVLNFLREHGNKSREGTR